MITNRRELMEFLTHAEKVIKEHGWEGRVTYPYPGCPMTAQKIITDCRDYDLCTEGTKDYLIDLAEGFRKLLEAWEEYDRKPRMQVRIKATGKVVTILKEDFEMFGDCVEAV